MPDNTLNIFINTTPLIGPRTGIGNYTLQITERLSLESRLSLTFFDGHYTDKLPQNRPDVSTGNHQPLLKFIKKSPHLFNLLKDILSKVRTHSLKHRHFDLYFEPAFIPLPIRAKHLVLTIHDFSFHLQKEWHPKDRTIHFQRHFWKCLTKAHHFIFISDFIRKQAIEEFGFDTDKCTTIHCGVDHNLFRPMKTQELEGITQRYNLHTPFILFTGSMEPRKNLQNLLKAYISLPNSIKKEVKLLLVGFSGWRNEGIMRTLQANKQDIRYIGYVPTEDLPGFYNLAELFVYPSFYEGFGLPPLEAMACGAPVIVSNTSAMPEVCGEAAMYINPMDSDQIAQAISTLLNNKTLRNRLSMAGKRRAELFSWDKAAEQHQILFHKVMAGDYINCFTDQA